MALSPPRAPHLGSSAYLLGTMAPSNNYRNSWGRLAGSQVGGCGNAEKDLGSSTETGFAGNMINGRGFGPKDHGKMV